MKPLPQAAPEGADTPTGEHFAYAPTPCNTRWHAYLAGPAQWVWCHEPKRTKPCLAILTNRELECPWCGTDKPVVRKAYVPLYRAVDWTPRCVIVTELYEETISKLKLHDRITVGKEAETGDPVWIIKALEQRPAFDTTKAHRKLPVNLTRSLVKLWANEALRRWCEGKPPAPAPAESDKPLSLPEAGKPVTTWEQFVGIGSGGSMEGTVSNPGKHRNDQFVAETKAKEKPSKNGQHKPSG